MTAYKRTQDGENVFLETMEDDTEGGSLTLNGYGTFAGRMTHVRMVLHGSEDLGIHSTEGGVEVDLYLRTDRLNKLAPLLMKLEGEQAAMEERGANDALKASDLIPGQTTVYDMLEESEADTLQRLAEEDIASKAAAEYDDAVEVAELKAQGLL